MKIAALLLTFSLFFVITITAKGQQRFNCSSPARCQALIDYISPNKTTLFAIQTLFGVQNLTSLLGANSFSLSTSPNQTVAEQERIKIPFPCTCLNGTGISDQIPVYIVKSGDNLDLIARDIFSGLVTYQKIAAVNKIPDPSLIQIGQILHIPLPCSCDAVDGNPVVHYGYLVPSGSSVEQIAKDYGTTEATLLKLNGIADPKDLKALEVLDVPLRACTSSVNSTSLDYPLLVPNGTYSLTANGCVQCKCSTSNNWKLNCEPSQSLISSKWSVCPSTQCGSSKLYIGNTTLSGCRSTGCAYAGYNNQNILTTLTNESTCASPSPSPTPTPKPTPTPPPPPPGNFASKNFLQGGSSLRFLLMSLNLCLLCFGLLW